MAVFVITNPAVILNSVDMSAMATEVELDVEVEDKETTDFASALWKESIGGKKSGSLKIKFQQDFAASQVDALLWPLLGTVVTFEVRGTGSAVGATNPKFTGSVLVNQYQPIKGAVGDVATVDVTFPTSGAVTRATS